MTIDDETEEHRVRCQPHLIALRMLAAGEAAAGFPRQAAADVIRATKAVLAEAEAADRTARTAGGDSPRCLRTGTFLGVRLSRLAAAADDAITAAAAGDSAQLRRHLRRFEALTSAIWTVQESVYGSGPRRRRPPRPHPAGP